MQGCVHHYMLATRETDEAGGQASAWVAEQRQYNGLDTGVRTSTAWQGTSETARTLVCVAPTMILEHVDRRGARTVMAGII